MKINLKEISHREALGMVGLLFHVSGISEIDHNALLTIKEKVEDLFISDKKGTSIKDFIS